MGIASVGGVLRRNALDLGDEVDGSSRISPRRGDGETHPDRLAIFADVPLHELVPPYVGRSESAILLDFCLEVVRMRDVTGVQRLEIISGKAEHSAERAVRLNDAPIGGYERHGVGGVLEGIREQRLALPSDRNLPA